MKWNVHCFQLFRCIQIFGTPTTELAKILDKLNGNIIFASSFRTISQQRKIINNLKKCNFKRRGLKRALRELIIKSLNQFNWRKAQYLLSLGESWENKLVETCQNNDVGNEKLIMTRVCASNTTDANVHWSGRSCYSKVLHRRHETQQEDSLTRDAVVEQYNGTFDCMAVFWNNNI